MTEPTQLEKNAYAIMFHMREQMTIEHYQLTKSIIMWMKNFEEQFPLEEKNEQSKTRTEDKTN